MEEKKPQTINEEASLPDNWIPVDAPPLIPSLIVPTADGSSKYLQGSLPPGFQHDVSFTGTAYRQDRTPQLSLMPLGIQGNPASNAAVQSTSTQVTEQVIAATPPSTGGGGGLASVGLAMPREFIVTNSPVTEATQPGPLTAAWAPEAPSTFLGAPAAGLTGFQGSTVAAFFQAGSGGTTLSVGQTPTSATSFGLLVLGSNSNLSTPSGWTAVAGLGVHLATYYKAITGTSLVGVSEALTGTDINWAASISLFTGPAPTFVQSNNATTKSGTVAFSSNNTAGNTLIVVMQYLSAAANAGYSPLFSDSNGNVYTRISNNTIPFTAGTSGSQVQQSVFVAPNCIGGANTITYSFSGPTPGIPTFSIAILEFGPLPAGAGIPLFRFLSSADIPPINLGSGGNGGVGGVLRVINGGTGSDLSATGGTSQVLKQTASGANVTVGQLAASDLSNGTTGSGAVVLAAAPTLTGAVTGGTFNATATATGVSGAAVNGYDSTTKTPIYNSNNNGVSAFSGAWNNVNVSPVTVNANVSTDQNLMSASVPAGTLNRVGRTLRVWLAGVYNTPAASTSAITVKVQLGTLTLINITTAALGSLQSTNGQFNILAHITTQTSGASGAFEPHGNLTIDLGAGNTVADSIYADTNTSTVGNLDLTASQTLQITIAFSSASASNSATQRQMILETVN